MMNLTDKQIIAYLAAENYRLECENKSLKTRLDHSLPVQTMSAAEFVEIFGGMKNG